MHRLLPAIRSRIHWSKAARTLFGGQGSFGNGAAMRVAPLGAYFADDLDALTDAAARSAAVTHAHPEGIAGAVAVAAAAAWATRLSDEQGTLAPSEFLDRVVSLTPESNVRVRLVQARDLRDTISVAHAAATLGNGERISAQDAVPFTVWCAARHLGNFEEAMWATVSALGDRDTNCAIVGGIVACATGAEGIPDEWRAAREPLPEWDES
jgi:ADP-ribosylglycohydrolase